MSRRRSESANALAALVVFLAVLLFLAIGVQSAIVDAGTTAVTPTPTPAQVTTPFSTALPVPSPMPTPLPVLRVGIQSGHLQACDVPEELAALKCAWGVSGDGWDEVVVNHQIAQKVADLLRREGLEVDILPTTIPEGYKADVFVALHCDGFEDDPSLRGFKVARSDWSKQPAMDDTLVSDLVTDYRATTGIPEDMATISDNMTQYYAFNYIKYHHAISPSTPAAIIEMGFLTNDADRELLMKEQDKAARGIARAVLDFLGRPSRTGL
ncbi:MAG: N-acetylmuramoyl-L-alanine amidase [Actinobacteria bacterium]|nr:N-acetylmuramoyl-L-alanine amidase [Actinomycetota bacterium]